MLNRDRKPQNVSKKIAAIMAISEIDNKIKEKEQEQEQNKLSQKIDADAAKTIKDYLNTADISEDVYLAFSNFLEAIDELIP